MFSFAQYVFGIINSTEPNQTTEGQSLSSSPSTCPSSTLNCDKSNEVSPTSYDNLDENESSHCLQTSIEDDWILIEVGDENSNVKNTPGKNKNVRASITKLLRNQSKTKTNRRGEKWVVDPPECFINKTTQKVVHRAASSKISTPEDDSKENLLIEFPSNIVFESLFVKRNDSKASILSESKSELVSSIENVTESPVKDKKSNKKSRKVETLHNTANSFLLSSSPNNDKAITIVAKGENKKRKRSITRKHHERQNRVNIQRNGPIIRGKKMFTTLNGAYSCTRH